MDSEQARKAQQKYVKENQGTHKLDEYKTHLHGNSVVCSISPTARNMLDISQGDSLEQHISIENGLILLVPIEQDSEPENTE